ncbi:MAG: pseudouridine synthase [Thermoanaerobaculia bacterium]
MPAKKLPPGNLPLKTLERVISKAGAGSRRDARAWASAGRVRVNGQVVRDPDRWVDVERDVVSLDGNVLHAVPSAYLLLNKPAGYLVTRHDPEKRPTIYDLLPESAATLLYAGRLDMETSGLLILTDDAKFAERLTNPVHDVPKTYRVTPSSPLDDVRLAKLRDGIVLNDGLTRPAIVSRVPASDSFDLTITEGRNRQVRRMVEALGAKVVALDRIAIGAIVIGDLPRGEARQLTSGEIASLHAF